MAKLRANVGQRMDPETQEFRAKVDEFVQLQFDRFFLEPIRAMTRVGDELKWAAGLGPEPKDRATLLDVFEATGAGVGAGAPGGGTGPANILRKDALGQLRHVVRLREKYGVQTDPRLSPRMAEGLKALPQKELDRVEKLTYRADLGGRNLGDWNRGTGEVRIRSQRQQAPESTLYHEVGHARALPGVPYLRRKRPGSLSDFEGTYPTRTELRARRGAEGFAEQMIATIDDMGDQLAEQVGKKFYWENPTETLAREVERRVVRASDKYKIPDPEKYQLVKGSKLPEAEYKRIDEERWQRAVLSGTDPEKYINSLYPIEDLSYLLDRSTREIIAVGKGKEDVYYNFLRDNQDYTQAPIPDEVYDQLYREALQFTLEGVKEKAPKVYRKAYEETQRRFNEIRNPPES